MFRLERERLAPYELPPNRLSRDMYDNLPLPWNVSPPVTQFPESLFVRKEWDRDGVLSNGKAFFGAGREFTADEAERSLATSSMVTRWRAANPDLAGTEKDVVRQFGNEIQEALGETKTVITGSSTVILLFKKSDSKVVKAGFNAA